MSSKFLPFIKNTSSDTAVFKAVIQRSKGTSYANIATLFAIIIDLGIDKVREKLEKFPEMMTITECLNELISQHTPYVIPKKELSFWAYIMKHYENHNGPQSTPYTREEREVLFAVLAYFKPDSLPLAGFDTDKAPLKKLASFKEFSYDNFNEDVVQISSVLFKTDAPRIGFTCFEELKAFIAVRESDKPNTTIMPILMKLDSNGKLSKAAYAQHHCKTPYEWE
jgi:hypothetical protein